MRIPLLVTILVFGLSSGVSAQTAEVTATCNDGTTWPGTSRRGACSGHRGVQAFGTGPAAVAPTGGPAASPPVPTPTPPPSTTTAPAGPATAAAPGSGQGPSHAAAPTGGARQGGGHTPTRGDPAPP